MTEGDKQMLIDTIRDAYRDITGNFVEAETVITVPAHRPAANAGSFVNTEMQARRQRRQRRLQRAGHGHINGWTVRTW
jgi:hypothetical protein